MPCEKHLGKERVCSMERDVALTGEAFTSLGTLKPAVFPVAGAGGFRLGSINPKPVPSTPVTQPQGRRLLS